MSRVPYVTGCGIWPGSPVTQKLVGRLHERCEEVLRNVNPDAVRGAILREMRMVKAVLKEEYGIDADGIYVTVTDGTAAERIDLP